jgi:hypothetical protein
VTARRGIKLGSQTVSVRLATWQAAGSSGRRHNPPDTPDTL